MKLVVDKNVKRRIKRLLVLQNGTIKSYDRAAYVTTEEDLKTILNDLSADHREAQQALIAQTFEERPLLRSFRKVFSFFERIWKNFAAALVLNNRRKILEYIWQSETKMLQEIQPLKNYFAGQEEMYRIFTDYEQRLKANFRALENLLKTTNQENAFV